MGYLAHFSLGDYFNSHKVQHFVETGLGGMDGILHAKSFPFKTLYSCEINEELYNSGKAVLQEIEPERGKLLLGSSVDCLKIILNEIPKDEPILFWLDAHYPGADNGKGSYKDKLIKSIKFPLIEELEIITSLRPNHIDVILCDDYRIYYDSHLYTHGRLPDFADPRYEEIPIPKGYLLKEDFNDEGYLIFEGILHGQRNN